MTSEDERRGLTRWVVMASLAIAWMIPLALGQQAADAHPDTPYTAIVGGREARFVFPLPHRDYWEFGGPAEKETTEFEWSVQVGNDAKRYTFGIFVTESPGAVRTTSQQPPAFFGHDKVLVAPVSGGDATLVSEARVYARPGGLASSPDYQRLVIVIDDPASLRLLFYDQPALATFREKFPGQTPVTHFVPVTYLDYDYLPPVHRLDATWTKAYSDLGLPVQRIEPVAVAISENGRCAAVAGVGKLEVIDSTGQLLWRWNYAQTNRLITPGTLALSPSCDEIAMTGSSSYKYTWVADRGGRTAYVHTTSTPLAVAFDHQGKLVVIGTGGNDVLLLTTGGKLRWKKEVKNGLDIVGQLSFSSDNRSILVRGGYGVGVLNLDGRPVWTYSANGMSAALDLHTFVAWWQPSHGGGVGHVAALDKSGKELWSKFSYDPGAVISPTGDKIIARINVNQSLSKEEGPDSDDWEMNLQVISRDGAAIRTLPVQDATPVAVSPDGERVLVKTPFGIEEVGLDGNRLLEIPLGEWPVLNEVLVADDFGGVLVLARTNQGAELSWYSLKGRASGQ